MSSSASHGIVALLFSEQTRDKQSWQPITEAAVQVLRSHFPSGSETDDPHLRHLDLDSKYNGHRVIELKLATTTAPTLRACKDFTDGETWGPIQTRFNVQAVLQPLNLYTAHRKPGLAVFDMDSTLIQQEVIDELARAVGLYEKVAAITEAAMRGEAPYTDFEASLRARVALLKGVPDSVWEQLKKDCITFTPGAPELLRTLKRLGWKTAVLSGGFTPLAYWVKDTLGLDYAHANHLVSDPALQSLTGELVPEAPIIHGEKKRELLLQLAAENEVPVENVIAVGDGSNDLPMMGAAGLGIAFNAKPKVQLAAPSKLNGHSLLDVMHILGYSQDEIEINET